MGKKQRRSFGSITYRKDRSAWFVKFRFAGVDHTRKAGTSETEADRMLAQVEEMSLRGFALETIDERVFGRQHRNRLTFKEIAPLYLDSVEKRKRPSTLRNDVYRLSTLCRTRWAAKPLRSVTRADIRMWMDTRLRSVALPTMNRDLSLASAVFQWALERDYVSENPLRSIRRATEMGRARTMWFAANECRAMLDAADDVLHPILLVLLHTGLRSGELQTLEWRSVDFEAERIHVEPEFAKSRRGRHVPMTPQTREVLSALRLRHARAGPHEKVFRTPRGKPMTKAFLRRRLDTFKKKTIDGIATERLRKLTLHVLRHSFASHLAQAGVPLQVIAQLLGHSSTYVTEIYSHLSPNIATSIGTLLGERLGGTDGDAVRDREEALVNGLRCTAWVSQGVSETTAATRQTA